MNGNVLCPRANARDVSKYDAALARARVVFERARTQLVSLLEPFGAPKHVEDHLLSFAEDYGLVEACQMLRRRPAYFGLMIDADAAPLASAGALLGHLLTTADQIDAIVDLREALLCAVEPGRARTFIYSGREYIFDEQECKVTYVRK